MHYYCYKGKVWFTPSICGKSLIVNPHLQNHTLRATQLSKLGKFGLLGCFKGSIIF